MEIKYSKNTFEGYTHRFIVNFEIDDDWRNDVKLTIYSNSGEYKDLLEFIENNKSTKVKKFKIEHKSTKEYDDISSKIIDEILNKEKGINEI